MSEPEEKPIRVVDRRMFTREGELRPGVEPEEPAPEKPAELPRSEPAVSSAPEPGPAPPESEGASAAPGAGAAASSDFLFLVQFLYSNALAALGVDPVTGAALPRRDLAFGRRMIDALAALESKTRGNLAFEETNLLSQVLYQLRMDYVDATRGPAPGPVPPGPVPPGGRSR